VDLIATKYSGNNKGYFNMATFQHSSITGADVHSVLAFTAASTSARDALSVVVGDIGKVCRVTADNTFYILTSTSPAVWSPFSPTPSLATVATSGAYADLTGAPSLATVATSGAYADLTGAPTIPAVYTLPTSSTSVLGGVKVDGSTIDINGSGVISVIGSSAATPTARGAVYGSVDNLENTGIGKFAQATVSTTLTGDRNTSVGVYSLYSITSGNDNAGLGHNSLRGLISGNQNSGFGAYSLKALTTGNRNVGFGAQSGANITGGYGNIAVGVLALDQLRDGSQNIAIGQDSLKALRNDGSTYNQHFNIAIGAWSGTTLTSGYDNIIIGTNAEPSSATVSGEVTLGTTTSINRFRIPGIGLDISKADAQANHDGKVLTWSTAANSSAGGFVWTTPSTSYTLPTASTTVSGGVKVDGTTIAIDGSGVISSIASAAATPTAYSKRLMLTGSSTISGTGASSYANSYAGKLTTALTARGWTVANTGISGNASQNVIDRFYTDIAPFKPDVVMIGLTIANEGISGNVNFNNGKFVGVQTYLKNIYKLVDMCRQIGAKAIIAGQFSRNEYNGNDYAFAKFVDKELQASNIPYILLMGTVDDGTGNYKTFMTPDGVHPNDLGHEAMYRAIPLSMFDRIPNGFQYWDVDYPSSGVYLSTNDNVASPINIPLDNVNNGYTISSLSVEPIGCYSVAFWIKKRSGAANGLAFFAANNNGTTGAPLRLRQATGSELYELATGGTIVASAVSAADLLPHHVVITYQYQAGQSVDVASLYIDGVLIGSANTNFVGQNPYSFSLLGRPDNAGVNAVGYEMSKFGAWKSALTPDQVKEAYRGRYPKGGCIAYLPLSDANTVQGIALTQVAASDRLAIVNSANIVSV
jgi:lysophospholipase L1-like esterase